MKFIFALLTTLFFVAPVWAIDVTMGSNGNLIFDPSDITIHAGDTVNFNLSDSSLSYTQSSTKYPAFYFELYKTNTHHMNDKARLV